ncbi:MAG: anti-sigma-factor antagonist [Mycobacterium sp.]|jgi:anti-sigma B factor antagonist|nr:anti-sigma-factor antagonist [Mycobacterium sp.]
MVEHPGGHAELGPLADKVEFEVNEDWVGQVIVLSVSGAVDMLSAPRLTESIRAAIPKAPTGLIIDLSNVEFLASAGMSVLVAAHEQVTPSARFGVVADGPATSRPIKLVGIADIVSLYPTLGDALADFDNA